MIYLKIYGLERSGTNYLRYLLEENFEDVTVFGDVLGWKHGYPTRHPSLDWRDWYSQRWAPIVSPLSVPDMKRALDSGLRYLLIVKNPYDWIESILHYEGNKKPTPHQLSLRVAAWVSMTRYYFDFSRNGYEDTVVMRYEGLPDSLLEIQRIFSLDRVGDVWRKPEGHLTRGSDLFPARYWDSHGQRAPRERVLRKEHMDMIEEILPRDLLETLQYERPGEAASGTS